MGDSSTIPSYDDIGVAEIGTIFIRFSKVITADAPDGFLKNSFSPSTSFSTDFTK